jgi:hypothetical protein
LVPVVTAWLQDYGALVVAALSLGVSVAFGVRNRSTAKRALELSEQQEARRTPRLDLRLLESVAWRGIGTTPRILGFNVVVANPTDRQSALVRAELHLTYTINAVVTTVKVPQAAPESLDHVPEQVSQTPLPARLDAGDAVSGWFLFSCDDDLTGGSPIDRYDFVLRDTHAVEEAFR